MEADLDQFRSVYTHFCAEVSPDTLHCHRQGRAKKKNIPPSQSSTYFTTIAHPNLISLLSPSKVLALNAHLPLQFLQCITIVKILNLPEIYLDFDNSQQRPDPNKFDYQRRRRSLNVSRGYDEIPENLAEPGHGPRLPIIPHFPPKLRLKLVFCS